MSDYVRFTVLGLTMADMRREAEAELERLTGVVGVRYSIYAVGETIDLSTSGGVQGAITRYEATIEATL